MHESLITTIGGTPTVHLERFVRHNTSDNLSGENHLVYGKIEARNPLYCVKCRTAWGMIRKAEEQGLLKPGMTIVEPTSGNTGIGLAWVARIQGYKVVLCMPETMSIERRRILAFLGATVVLTDGSKGMKGAVEKSLQLVDETGGYLPNQFSNPGNPEIHYQTTGPEMWKDMGQEVDFAVFGVGTGGTLTGAGKYLKEQNPSIKIVAVEPKESAILSGNDPGPHKIQGIGAGFAPEVLDRSLIDLVEQVSSEEAIDAARQLALSEGIFAGISSGAAAHAARNVAEANPGKRVICILPDLAERYLSSVLFDGI